MAQPSGVDQRQARPQRDREREQADREIPAGRVHRFTTGRKVDVPTFTGSPLVF